MQNVRILIDVHQQLGALPHYTLFLHVLQINIFSVDVQCYILLKVAVKAAPQKLRPPLLPFVEERIVQDVRDALQQLGPLPHHHILLDVLQLLQLSMQV